MLHTFTVSTHAEYLNDAEQEQEYSNPDTDIDIISPKLDSDTSSSELKGQNGQPANCIIPSYREATAIWVSKGIVASSISCTTKGNLQRRIHESNDIGEESSIDREQDGHFSKSLNRA
jgi:viroplasmin and RNaseH domain-containing protein